MKAKRFIAAGDLHGDYQCEKTVRVLLDFKRDWRPELVIHGGDNWDFRALRKGAGQDEVCQSLADDIECGMKFLHDYRPTHFLCGNHSVRAFDLAENGQGLAGDFGRSLVKDIAGTLEKIGCQWKPYDKRKGVFKFGHLSFVHGFHSGAMAVKRAAEIWQNVVMFHIHAIDSHSLPSAHGRVMGRSPGCLCKLDMPYNRAQANTLRQANGFCYGLLYDDGTFRFQQAEEINGRWVMPLDFRSY